MQNMMQAPLALPQLHFVFGYFTSIVYFAYLKLLFCELSGYINHFSSISNPVKIMAMDSGVFWLPVLLHYSNRYFLSNLNMDIV